MGRLITSVVLFALTIATAVITSNATCKQICRMRDEITLMREADERDPDIRRDFEDLLKDWKRAEKIMMVYSNHTALDRVSESLTKIYTYLSNPNESEGQRIDLLAEYDRLLLLLDQMEKMEKIGYGTVL